MTKANRVHRSSDGWGAIVERTAESVSIVVRDWDVHVSMLFDHRGELRVRVYDPRDPLSPIVTMLAGNAYEALADAPPLTPEQREKVKQLNDAIELMKAVEDVFDSDNDE